MLYSKKELMEATWLSKYLVSKMILNKELKVVRIWKGQAHWKKMFIEEEEFKRVAWIYEKKLQNKLEEQFKILKDLKKWLKKTKLKKTKKVVEKKQLD